jgi:polyisoprenoid-binding protein YceI
MPRFLLAALLATTGLGLSAAAGAATYKIDPNHTQVQFTYNHFGYSNLSGRFNQVSGDFQFDPANPAAATISVELPMSSLSTGVPKLDEDLSGDGFFDVAKFPTASFKSNKVRVLGKDRLSVAGDLSIHGVTRPVVFAVTINRTGPHPMRKTETAGFDATTTIKRSEFGVGKLAPMVSDEVQLRISMEAGVPKADPPAAAPAKKG